MERVPLEVQRFTATRSFADESEANEAIQAKVAVPMNTIASTASTVERGGGPGHQADLRAAAAASSSRARLDVSSTAPFDAYASSRRRASTRPRPGPLRPGGAGGGRAARPAIFDEGPELLGRPAHAALHAGCASAWREASKIWASSTRPAALSRAAPPQPRRQPGRRATPFSTRSCSRGGTTRRERCSASSADEPTAQWQYGARALGLSPRGRRPPRASGCARRSLDPPRARLPRERQRVAESSARLVRHGQPGGSGDLRRRAGGGLGRDTGALDWLATHARSGKRRKRRRR